MWDCSARLGRLVGQQDFRIGIEGPHGLAVDAAEILQEGAGEVILTLGRAIEGQQQMLNLFDLLGRQSLVGHHHKTWQFLGATDLAQLCLELRLGA